MPCPLCRGVISGLMAADDYLLASQDELDDFATRRDDYVKKLRRPCARNAGFLGKNKFARSVASAMGNELEQRRFENAGTDRACSKSHTFEPDGDLLRVTYKVGRRVVKETAPFIQDWEEVKAAFPVVSDLVELTTYYPEAFWLCKFHKQTVAELIQPQKRRRQSENCQKTDLK